MGLWEGAPGIRGTEEGREEKRREMQSHLMEIAGGTVGSTLLNCLRLEYAHFPPAQKPHFSYMPLVPNLSSYGATSSSTLDPGLLFVQCCGGKVVQQEWEENMQDGWLRPRSINSWCLSASWPDNLNPLGPPWSKNTTAGWLCRPNGETLYEGPRKAWRKTLKAFKSPARQDPCFTARHS